MTRRKIILRSLFLLLIPAGFGIFESIRGNDFHNGGSFALTLLMWISFEVAVLLVLSLVLFIRALLINRKTDTLDGSNGKEGKYLYLKKMAGSYLIAAGLVLLIGASLCYGGIAAIKAF